MPSSGIPLMRGMSSASKPKWGMKRVQSLEMYVVARLPDMRAPAEEPMSGS